jgi:hypothetical protein
MRRLYVFLLLAISLVSLSLSSSSAAWEWLVQKTSGDAVYSSGTAALALKQGLLLDRGTKVRTGINGKVLLVRGVESVFIGPSTVASIAAEPTPGMKTTVLLQRGKVSLDVRKKAAPHFSVETPFMVAVVKGTKFTVSVGSRSSEVFVSEGRVEVRAFKSGDTVNVSSGQSARVNAQGKVEITSAGTRAPITKGLPEAAMIESKVPTGAETPGIDDSSGSSGSNNSGNSNSGSGSNNSGSNSGSGSSNSGSNNSGSSNSGSGSSNSGSSGKGSGSGSN